MTHEPGHDPGPVTLGDDDGGGTTFSTSTAGLPPGFVRGSDGIVYRQVKVTDAQGTRTQLRPATPQELSELNAGGSSGGLTFEEQMALRQTPSVSFSTSQSLLDPRSLELQARQLEEQIRQWNQQYGIDLETLKLQRDQLALSEEQGHRRDALQLAEAVATQQDRVQQNRIAFQGLRQQAEALNAQLRAQAREGAANRAFQAAQSAADRAIQLTALTDQNLSKNIDQQITIAAQLADFSAQPGDVIRNVAALEGFGSLSSAIAQDFSAITDESLARGGLLLEQQDAAQGEEQRLRDRKAMLTDAIGRALSPTLGTDQFMGEVPQVSIPEMGGFEPVDIQGLFNQFLGGTGSAGATPSPQQTAQQRTQEQLSNQQFAQSDGGLQSFRQGALSDIGGGGTTDDEFSTLPDFVKRALSFRKGGVAPGMAVVHDDELVVSPHPFLVLNEKQQQAAGLDGTDAPKAQTGGFFGGGGQGLFNRLAEGGFIDRARDLADETFSRGSSRFQQAAPGIPTVGGVPTPVGVSAPGTSSFLQRVAAALAASGRGIDPELFLEESRRVAPTGVASGVVRRTR